MQAPRPIAPTSNPLPGWVTACASSQKMSKATALKAKVAAGKLGMRTGEGFRTWTKQSADAVRERLRNYLAEQAKAAKKK